MLTEPRGFASAANALAATIAPAASTGSCPPLCSNAATTAKTFALHRSCDPSTHLAFTHPKSTQVLCPVKERSKLSPLQF